MELSVQSDDGGILRLRVKGRITQTSMPPDMSDRFLGMLGRCGYAQRVLLDLAGSEFVDSSGLSWLVLLEKRFREANGLLIVHSVPLRVMEVIRVMSLDRVLRIADDEASALAVARGEAA